MAELCLSTSTLKPQLPFLMYSSFAHFTAFILSHPLYFSYFIFFSPYLLKLLSFLSPLFITTSLLLLLLLGLVHDNSITKLSEFVRSTLHENGSHDESKDLNRYDFEEFEAYKLVFMLDTQASDAIEHYPMGEKRLQDFDHDQEVVEVKKTVGEVDKTEGSTADLQVMEEKRLQEFFKDLDDFENYDVDEKTVDPLSIKSIKVVEEHVQESKVIRKGSEANDVTYCDNGGEYTKTIMSDSKSLDQNRTKYTSNLEGCPLGSYGSMRKEKEWKRTLACKLFEERHNAASMVEGDEGIDALWETYESQDLSKSTRIAMDTKKKKKKEKEKETEMNYDDYGDEEDDNEEFEITHGQLCCLQALKFSARKMNLGMGRPNLVKFSKAIKGIAWIKRHGKGRFQVT